MRFRRSVALECCCRPFFEDLNQSPLERPPHRPGGPSGIGVTGSQEDGCAVEGTLVTAEASRRTDQYAGQPCHCTKPSWVAGDEFQGQTGALGKAGQNYLIGRNAGRIQALNDRVEDRETGAEIRLVGRDPGQKALWIPRKICCARCDQCQIARKPFGVWIAQNDPMSSNRFSLKWTSAEL